ncbi:MAG TPA: FMN-binding negative transcriptional regulator [Candidatus Limnocylindrales bacterium]|nr:FMN-binding negative transcriptional regulator [Candidatus Limnocylindrales bacterium]
MYVPNHFSMSAEQVGELLTGIGAADLITAHESGLAATFLPFLFDPDGADHGSLITHVARNNSQARDPVLGEAMVIVHGAEHYVSPRWLPSLAEGGQVVPTWNYLTVHAYGRLIVHDDPEWTEDAVRRLTAAHETDYSVDQVPADYIERMLRAIVGIEIQLTRVEAKAKMSQNKRPQDVRGIVDGLRTEAGDGPATLTASWMERHSVPAADARAALLDEISRTGRRGS